MELGVCRRQGKAKPTQTQPSIPKHNQAYPNTTKHTQTQKITPKNNKYTPKHNKVTHTPHTHTPKHNKATQAKRTALASLFPPLSLLDQHTSEEHQAQGPATLRCLSLLAMEDSSRGCMETVWRKRVRQGAALRQPLCWPCSHLPGQARPGRAREERGERRAARAEAIAARLVFLNFLDSSLVVRGGVWCGVVLCGVQRSASHRIASHRRVREKRLRGESLQPCARREHDVIAIMGSSATCSVCLGALDLRQAAAIPCGHCFHADCIFLSIEAHKESCPLCNKKTSVGEIIKLFFSEDSGAQAGDK